MLAGLDLSSWQERTDFTRVPKEYSFIIVKCTEANDYVNPYYKQQIGGARDNGFDVGHYMFNRLEKATAKQEVDYFLKNADVRDGEPVFLDIEEILSYVRDISDEVLERCELLEEALGFAPGIYTYPWYFRGMGLNDRRLVKYPLWYAQVEPSTWPAASSVAPYKDATIHQYTTDLVVPGISGAATVDGNTFKGTREDFRNLGRANVVINVTPSKVDPGFPGAVQSDRSVKFNSEVLPGAVADQVSKVRFTLLNAREGQYYNVVWDGYNWSSYSVVGNKAPVEAGTSVDPGFPGAIQSDRSVKFNDTVLPGAVADQVSKVIFTLFNDEDHHYYEVTWDGHRWSEYRIVG